jgi:hypothetical protein
VLGRGTNGWLGDKTPSAVRCSSESSDDASLEANAAEECPDVGFCCASSESSTASSALLSSSSSSSRVFVDRSSNLDDRRRRRGAVPGWTLRPVVIISSLAEERDDEDGREDTSTHESDCGQLADIDSIVVRSRCKCNRVYYE